MRIKSNKPAHHGRNERMADLLQQELAMLLKRELKDPRLQDLFITEVQVTPDLSHAKVYVTHPKGEAQFQLGAQALQRAKGFLRSQVAQVLNTYSVPQLHFEYDNSVARGAAISSLIAQAIKEDQSHPKDE